LTRTISCFWPLIVPSLLVIWPYACRSPSCCFNVDSHMPPHIYIYTIIQDGARKIAKLRYQWLNYGLW
jgi:hypothetical protein